jgi:2',3'-cyclic-nucleotide 2'-phosphodiesterase (5'-nucleotidase family)
MRFGRLLFLLVIALTGCGQLETAVTPAVGDAASVPTREVVDTPFPATEAVRELTVLYTNDEHGWMEGMEPGEGAANLINRWREQEGYVPDGSFLILSGGDMWTGPAISTWFDGQSMAEVMNEMGYTAAAVGNHEFDFGLESLQQRAGESTFPFLSANIRYRDSGETPTDLGIQPFVVVEANGIQVGIVGLTTTSTPRTTNPVNVADFEFMAYEAALREVVPQVKEAGAELILVPGHICRDELVSLANVIGDLGVHLLGGGHCNELFTEEANGIVILEGGYHFTSYARVTFQFDTVTDTVVSADYGVNFNTGSEADARVDGVVMRWQEEAEVELEQVIGYTEMGIDRRSPEMESLITGAWLAGYPADIAVTNLGGIRAGIPAGEITLSDVIGVMPFSNVLIELELTGEQLLTLLGRNSLAIAGAYRTGALWLLEATDEPVQRDENYRVLVNDFMYAGGDGLDFLAAYDPDGYNTAIDWRQPVIDWIVAQQSSATSPIDAAILQFVQ